MFLDANPGPVKAALALRRPQDAGKPAMTGAVRPPLCPPAEGIRAAIAAAIGAFASERAS